MSTSGMYFLTTKSGNVVRNSLLPMKPWLNLGQKQVFVSGDIFLDQPLPEAVTHLHDGENFDIRVEMENVSSDGVEKYRVNFKVVSAPDQTQDLADALEHFLLGSHDLLWERASMRKNKRHFMSSIMTAHEVQQGVQKNEAKEAKEELRKLGPLGGFLAGFLDKLDDEDPTKNPFGFGERHELMGPGFCGIGIEKKTPSSCFGGQYESTGNFFLDMILGIGQWHDHRPMDDDSEEDGEMGDFGGDEEASADHVDEAVPATEDGAAESSDSSSTEEQKE